MHSVLHSFIASELLGPSLRPHAYLDPGSGSLLIQLLLAALLAVPFLIKAYWKKMKAFLTRSPKKTETEEIDDETKQQ